MVVFDLHCDLLSYLAGNALAPRSPRSAYNNESRTSISQLMKGGVAVQTLVIYTPTKPWSVRSGLRQLALYQEFPNRYKNVLSPFHSNLKADIKTCLAIENASALVYEDEPLQKGLDRLDMVVARVETPLYISLTWNEENRFGGGANAQAIGLKPDGKVLLEWAKHNGVCIDFSHTSDKLAEDILNSTSSKVLASHSNFRDVCPVARNLPKQIAQEIARRGGVIGLNFVRPFVGATSSALLKHIEYAHTLGIENALALGADLFSTSCIPASQRKSASFYFFDDLENASCYPKLRQMVTKAFGENYAERLFYKTAFNFCRARG